MVNSIAMAMACYGTVVGKKSVAAFLTRCPGQQDAYQRAPTSAAAKNQAGAGHELSKPKEDDST